MNASKPLSQDIVSLADFTGLLRRITFRKNTVSFSFALPAPQIQFGLSAVTAVEIVMKSPAATALSELLAEMLSRNDITENGTRFCGNR